MPKLKSHSGISKRVKITGKGKVSYKKPGKSHLLTHKTRARKRQLRRSGIMTKAESTVVKRLLPYS
ncbi:MAG TPA: 50S ribosomal protein L35 [Nitrospiria bacterium]|nr:50S ribosomal protein L35 [Nitrospiria bacterium]